MEQKIVKFIKRHHVLTLATMSAEGAYCANAFYAYDEKQNRLIFTSSQETRHAQEMAESPRVAASIVWETKLVGRIQGLQLTGDITKADSEAKKQYIKRFPYTAVADLSLWCIDIKWAKYTDNTLGFGTKLIWSAE